MSELISRIERLETSNKRLQIVVYCFPALAVVAMLLGAKNSSPPPDGKFRNVTAEKIVVGSFDGKPSVVLTAENANGLDLAMVHIIDGDGDTRASLGHVDGRMTKFVIYGADGAKTELRASEKAGGTSIELTPSGSKESSIELKTDRDGGAGGLRVKCPETGKWARIVYNANGAFVDTDGGDEVTAAAYETSNDNPDLNPVNVDVQDTNKTAAQAKKAKREQNEKNATAQLRAAERFIKNGNREHGRGMLTDLINKYPDTKAAAESSKLLK